MTSRPDDEDPIVTVNDVRLSGFCVSGLRDWSAKHGIPVKDLINGRVHASDLEAVGDANGIRVAEAARKRAKEQ